MVRFCIRSLVAFCLLSLPAAALTVDIDARINVRTPQGETPVFLLLDAGEYIASPVAGLFTAWHAWSPQGTNRNCQGDACTQGWVNNWSIFTPDTSDIPFETISAGTGVSGRPAWRTADLALEHAGSLSFTLDSTQLVGFLIVDHPIFDNAGGMTVKVQPVGAIPLPAAGLLLLTGLAGVVLLSRMRPV